MKALRMFLVFASLGLLLGPFVGCAALNPRPPVEAFADKFTTEVVGPAVQNALANGMSDLNLQAGAHVNNPKYVAEFEGYLVQGIKGTASVGVDGVAGQATLNSKSAPKAAPPEDRLAAVKEFIEFSKALKELTAPAAPPPPAAPQGPPPAATQPAAPPVAPQEEVVDVL